jgi:hypothetical protein
MSSPVSATPASTWAWLGLATLGFRVDSTLPSCSESLSIVTFDNDSEQDGEVRRRFDDEFRYRSKALMQAAEWREGSQTEIDIDLSTRASRPAACAPKPILKPSPQFGREAACVSDDPSCAHISLAEIKALSGAAANAEVNKAVQQVQSSSCARELSARYMVTDSVTLMPDAGGGSGRQSAT